MVIIDKENYGAGLARGGRNIGQTGGQRASANGSVLCRTGCYVLEKFDRRQVTIDDELEVFLFKVVGVLIADFVRVNY